jgi:hypothetical protein
MAATSIGENWEEENPKESFPLGEDMLVPEKEGDRYEFNMGKENMELLPRRIIDDDLMKEKDKGMGKEAQHGNVRVGLNGETL